MLLGSDPNTEGAHSSQDNKFNQQRYDVSKQTPLHLQQQRKEAAEQDCVAAKSCLKSAFPLATQEFPIPKPGGKMVPRYTVQNKANMKPAARSSVTLPAYGHSSSSPNSFSPQMPNFLQNQTGSHFNGFNDDTGMQTDELPKGIMERRGSLQHIHSNSTDGSSDGMLFTLAEQRQNPALDPVPPSYTAIKQALLYDQYKRRPNTQTDPKTLKNLLQTKLVITDNTNEQEYLRRKSDPGLHMKQRDFERRKELFMDENMSWSKSYGKVIDQQVNTWQMKRLEKQQQREMLNWQTASASTLNPLKFQLINPLMPAQQNVINPLQRGESLNGSSSSAATALFPGNLSSSCMVNPYLFPQAIIPAGSMGTATPSMYYNRLNTQYAFVNPYPALQIGQVPSAAPAPATYLVSQAALAAAASQPKMLYYVPPSTSSSASLPSSSSAPSFITSNALPCINPPPSVSSANNLLNTSTSPPRISLFAPPIPESAPTWNTDHIPGMEVHKLRPVSPSSRKRHQSVPEKLTSLLQLPPSSPVPSAPLSSSSLSSGRSSPMDEEPDANPDSPPVSKKQRSVSDTTNYHSAYMRQLSPGRRKSPTPYSHSNSPQPPHSGGLGMPLQGTQSLERRLSPLQAHLLQVHQSYGISRSAVEERMNRQRKDFPLDKHNHSPLRKHSGGSLNNGSISPPLSLMEEEELVGGGNGGGVRVREMTSDMDEREMETGSEQGI